jgi:hypothetical protein
MPVRLALLSLAALLAPAAHCAAECPARDAGATATSLEEALASGAGWEGRAQSIFECIVPHTFTKGKYSFDDESRLGSRRGTETKEQCRLLRDTVQEVVQRWIKRDPAERENYVGQYVSLKSTFFVWVLPSLTGGRNDDAKSRFTSIFKACEEAHSKFGLHGDTREHIDMDRAPWLERGYQEWRRSQNSKSCAVGAAARRADRRPRFGGGRRPRARQPDCRGARLPCPQRTQRRGGGRARPARGGRVRQV